MEWVYTVSGLRRDQYSARYRQPSQVGLLARVSHDCRTPLNSIIGFTRIVLRRMEGKLPDLQKKIYKKC